MFQFHDVFMRNNLWNGTEKIDLDMAKKKLCSIILGVDDLAPNKHKQLFYLCFLDIIYVQYSDPYVAVNYLIPDTPIKVITSPA